MPDWTQVLVALAVGLPATIAALGAVFASWINSRKIDNNTNLTKLGSLAAQTSARDAATAAVIAATKADALSQRLNGGLEDKISEIVKAHTAPLVKAFKEHNDQDDRNMKEIRQALQDLRDHK